jgi:hypothetical protein
MLMLPQERTLMMEQRTIEKHFEMELDGEEKGKSVKASASLPRYIKADVKYVYVTETGH